MKKLDGKVAIITGGSSGIGEATVRLFAKEGAEVIIGDRMDDYGTKLADELGSKVQFIHTDVSEEKDIRALVRVARKMGQLDCIMNNAGYDKVYLEFDDISVKDFDEIIGVHLRATFLGMKYAVKIMKKQQSGSIINLGSVAGIQAGFGSHLYSTAKAGIIHLTRSVARELGGIGIRINCICPGGIATAIFGRALQLSQERVLEIMPGLKKILAGLQPIKRSGIPEDVANAALWLASDESSFVTGHALVVDGGITTGPHKEYSDKFTDDLLKLAGIELPE